MASGDSVQQIKDRLSIIDVISSYVELHQAGKNFKGRSPFTSEKTPSFFVSPDRGMYYCFSSSQGGDMFTFVEKMEGVDFKGALKILADKAGVELVPEDPKKRSERDRQYEVISAATKFFVRELSKNETAMSYLQQRGLQASTITGWQLGYAPGPPTQGWRELRSYLLDQKFSDQEIKNAGLSKEAGAGKEPYDTFRDRVMFPIFDPSGRVVAFSGRILSKDSDAPKYVNSPETELFNKSEVLYGYDRAKSGIRQHNFSLIVEGQFDVVLSHQAGYNNAVAVSGTALTAFHAGLLQRLSNRVVLALDSDRAGIAAVKRAADIMLSRGVDLKVAELPDGKDPADIIAEDTKAFKKIVGSSVHVIEFLLHNLKKETKDERSFKLKTREEVLPYLLKIDSQIDREHFVGLVAETLATTAEAIRHEVMRLEEHKLESGTNLKNDPTEEVPVQVVRESAKRIVRLKAYLVSVIDLKEPEFGDLIKSTLANMEYPAIEDMRGELPPEVLSETAFTLEKEWDKQKDASIAAELLDRLEEFRVLTIKKKIGELKSSLEEAEQKGDELRINECIKSISEQQKKLSNESVDRSFIDSFDR